MAGIVQNNEGSTISCFSAFGQIWAVSFLSKLRPAAGTVKAKTDLHTDTQSDEKCFPDITTDIACILKRL